MDVDGLINLNIAQNAEINSGSYSDETRELLFPHQFDTTGHNALVYASWAAKEIHPASGPATVTILALGIIGLATRRFKKHS